MSALLTSLLAAFSAPAADAPARVIALEYVREHAAALGVEAADLADVVVTSESVSESSGARHVYLRQRYRGIEIAGADMTVNLDRDGRVVSAVGEFVPRLASAVNRTRPSVARARAVKIAAHRVNAMGAPPREPVRLVFHRAAPDRLRLAWVVEIEQVDPPHWWVVTVDAASGFVLHVHDRVEEEARV